jgi:hypothetical protein
VADTSPAGLAGSGSAIRLRSEHAHRDHARSRRQAYLTLDTEWLQVLDTGEGKFCTPIKRAS